MIGGGNLAMAELEPGHPDELTRTLRNWLREAESAIGSLPVGTDPVEWAVRRFIASWSGPVRETIEQIEDCLDSALKLCSEGKVQEALVEIDSARQLVEESLRDDLGLYPWNKE
jgi:hypothetical protein